MPKNPEFTPQSGNQQERNESRYLEGIVFEKIDKKNGETEYRNNQPGRKIIILSDSSKKPWPNESYRVRILEDTKPEDSLSGKMIVEIVVEAGQNGSINETEDRISYLGVVLEKARDRSSQFVPDPDKYLDYINDKDLSLPFQRDIAIAFLTGDPILVDGGTSLGKTTTVRKMASELGYEIHYANLNGATDVEDLMGRYIPNPHKTKPDDSEYIFADGKVTSGLRQEEGKVKIIILDEFNSAAPNILIRLHEVLDALERNGDVVLSEDASESLKVSKGKTKVIALMNPPGKGYHGREPVDPAQLRRWIYKKLPAELPAETFSFATDALFGAGSPNQEASPDMYVHSAGEALAPEQLVEIPGMLEMLPKYKEFHRAAKEMVKARKIAEDQPQPFMYDDRMEPRRVRDFICRFYTGDINQTFRQALRYYYVNKLESDIDRAKLDELIKMVEYTPKPGDSKRKGADRGPVKKPENNQTTREKVVIDMAGKEMTVSDLPELYGWRVGQKFSIDDPYRLIPKLKDCKSVELVGMDKSRDFAVLLFDNGIYVGVPWLSIGEGKRYRPIAEKPEGSRFRKREFIRTSGGKVTVDERMEFGPYRVGQKVRGIQGKGADPEVVRAKNIEIIGFTEGNNWIVLQLDGGKVWPTEKEFFLDGRYEIIPDEGQTAPAKPEESKEITDWLGNKITLSNEKERDGLKVGDRFKPKPGRTDDYQPLFVRKNIEIIGFDKSSNYPVIITEDGVFAPYEKSVFARDFDLIPDAEAKDNFKGRDPKVFLPEVFDWIEKNNIGVRRNAWLFRADDKYVGMTLDANGYDIPKRFFDSDDKVKSYLPDARMPSGIEALLKELKGKRVRSVIAKNGQWLLEIIEGDNRRKEFTNIIGDPVIVNKAKEYGKYKVGQKVRIKPGADRSGLRSEEIEASDMEIVGFMESGKIVFQLDDGPVIIDVVSQFEKFFETIEDKPQRLKTFKALGGVNIEVSDEVEKYGFKVGQRFKPKPGKTDLFGAGFAKKEIEIVGFKGKEIVAQRDEGIASYFSPESMRESYDLISDTSSDKREESKKFTGLDGTIFVVTGEQEKFGLKVGQKLKVISNMIGEPMKSAKDIEIIGFEENGRDIIFRMDGDEIWMADGDMIGRSYEVVESSKGPREVISYIGTKIEIGEKIEANGYRVGQKFKVDSDRLAPQLKSAKECELIGIAVNGFPVMLFDNGKFGLPSWLNIGPGKSFEPIKNTENQLVEVTDTYGTKWKLREEQEMDKLRVGQWFKPRPGKTDSWSDEFKNKKIKIIGFSELSKGDMRILAQTEDGFIGNFLQGTIPDSYEIENAQAKERPSNVYTRVDNGEVVADTKVKEYMGIKVGQKVKLNPSAMDAVRREMREANYLEVVGFTGGKSVIVQLDGGKVMVSSVEAYNDWYEPAERQLNFITIDGKVIRVKKDTEMTFDGGIAQMLLRLGDQVILTTNIGKRRSLVGSITLSKKHEIVGFMPSGEIVVMLDNNRVTTFTYPRFKELYLS